MNIEHADRAGFAALRGEWDAVAGRHRDPFAGAAEEIGATAVVSTWVEGQQVFGA